jgi:hypothetical protein
VHEAAFRRIGHYPPAWVARFCVGTSAARPVIIGVVFIRWFVFINMLYTISLSIELNILRFLIGQFRFGNR